MRYLFIHQNFPGQFLHIIRHLLEKGDSEIVFISMPSSVHMEGVRHAVYRLNLPPHRHEAIHPAASDFDLAVRRAEQVAITATSIKNLGFIPDIIIGHEGWGELLNISDVFPGVPVLGYFEFFYHTDRNDVGFDEEFPMPVSVFPSVRAKNAVNLIALQNSVHGQTPTRFQYDTYPQWAQEKITVISEGVDIDICRPDPAVKKKDFVFENQTFSPKTKLVTYVSRNFEPYRGFNKFMRALPDILDSDENIEVVLVGGDSVSYGSRLPQGTWRELMMQEVGGRLDLSRVHFFDKVPYKEFCRLLQRSDAHVYLTYPFVVSWSLREALACGCTVIGSDTDPVRELITHNENGYLVSFHDPKKIAEGVIHVLKDQLLAHKLGKNARNFAETHLSMEDYLRRYEELINTLVAQSKNGQGSASLPKNPARGQASVVIEDSPEVVASPAHPGDAAASLGEPLADKASKKPAMVVVSSSSRSSTTKSAATPSAQKPKIDNSKKAQKPEAKPIDLLGEHVEPEKPKAARKKVGPKPAKK